MAATDEIQGGLAVPVTFPRDNFDFGGSLDLTARENAQLQQTPWDDNDAMGMHTWTCTALPHRKRKLATLNRLEQSEIHLGAIENPSVFWAEVLKLAPPKEWFNRKTILRYLANSKPMEKPANGVLWKRAVKWLDNVIAQGSQIGWRDDQSINATPAPPELWEAIRIIGDGANGFGTFPKTLLNKLHSAGLDWIAVSPSHRRVPKCWESWAKFHDIEYHEVAHVHECNSGKVRADVLTTDGERKRETRGLSPSRSVLNRASPRRTTTEPSPDIEEPPLFSEIMGASLNPKDSGTENVRAHEAPDKQYATPIVQPETSGLGPEPLLLRAPQDPVVRSSEIWKTVKEDLQSIVKHQISMRNEMIEEIQKFVTETVKDVVAEGPVKELVQETVDQVKAKFSEDMWYQESRILQVQIQLGSLEKQMEEMKTMEARLEALVEDKFQELSRRMTSRDSINSHGKRKSTQSTDGDEPHFKRPRVGDEVEYKSFVPIRWV